MQMWVMSKVLFAVLSDRVYLDFIGHKHQSALHKAAGHW